MRSFRQFFLSLRSLRAIAAACLLAALVSMFFLDQRAREELRLSTLETAMGMNWRLNDVIVETFTTKSLVDRMIYDVDLTEEQRAAHFKTVLLHYEILWSNVEIAKRTDLKLYENFNDQLLALETYLVAIEDVMYQGEIPPAVVLEDFARTVETTGRNLQRAWQNTQYYGVEMFIGREEERFAQTQAEMRQRTVLFLIMLLTVYLVVEAYLAGNMRRSEARLKAKAKSAALASEAKSLFLANVSHEIRTPLNGILGMASELRETPLDADQRACLQVISHAGDVLLHTLNDVLDLAKVEAGQLVLEKRVFDLHQLLDAAVGLYRARAEEKHLALRLDRTSAVPRYVEGDGDRISQVLHNLIGNAIKFTDAGSVTVRVTSGARDGHLRFSVIDTGSGLDASVQEKVFEPFSQADSSITRTKGGTGLGLSISRGLCNAMGGYLAVESQEGHGATFWLELPLPEGADLPRAAVFPAAGHPVVASDRNMEAIDGLKRVLIVDDNATNRLLLKRFLRGRSLEIAEARDGSEAVEAVLGARFDVVLMDVQMPVMDGIAATEIIRAREVELGRAPTRIIAITANVMTHQVEAYLNGGVDDVLSKPVSKAALLAILRNAQRSAA